MERQMEEELKNVPAWKKEIMMKRGGAIKNWGDEREDINEQVDNQQWPSPWPCDTNSLLTNNKAGVA